MRALHELKARLDAFDDKLVERIKAIEEYLREWVKIRVSIKLEHEDDTRLAFGKHEGKWCLLTARGDDGDVALLACPRDMRADVFLYNSIGELIADIPKQLEKALSDRELALGIADDLLASLTVKEI